eukprot:2194130-Rhodomonas_salina.1
MLVGIGTNGFNYISSTNRWIVQRGIPTCTTMSTKFSTTTTSTKLGLQRGLNRRPTGVQHTGGWSVYPGRVPGYPGPRVPGYVFAVGLSYRSVFVTFAVSCPRFGYS